MTYDVASQLQYTNVVYRTKDGLPKGATIASGGCGPSSVRNLGNNLLGWNTTIPKVAQIAVDCGARYNGGTTIGTLLAALKIKSGYGGFQYEYTTSDSAAIAAVKAGAMAIIHTPGSVGGTYNKLLSTSGHFLCLAAVSGTTATIIDSCVTTGKWTSNSVRKKYIKTTNQTGVVKCSITALTAAVDYYYIVKKAAKTTTTVSTTTPTKKENDDDMKYYKNLSDVPSYYKNAIQKLVNSGAMAGTGNGELNVSEDLCRMATVLNNAGILDLVAPKVYKTIDDIPSYYRAAVQKLIDRGAISGTGKGELNLSADICRSLTILDNAGLIDISDDTASTPINETNEKHYSD